MSRISSKTAVKTPAGTEIPVNQSLLGSKKFKVIKQDIKHHISMLAAIYRKSYGFGEQQFGKIGEIDTKEVRWVICKDSGPVRTADVEISAFVAAHNDPAPLKTKLVYSYHTGREDSKQERWEGGSDPIEQLLLPVDKIHAELQALQDWFTARSSDIEWAVERLQKLSQYPIEL